ncbi:hypothetical protein [Mycolicibacterium mengxianglii]|uniref:hypothetical protein n=1 Tax=Mycolicibacterium mengxianglii TaxID=2736649 RepID=UPI0018EEDAEA|nr:hypothetical protein [Mycolicibacterium mengxianglii]
MIWGGALETGFQAGAQPTADDPHTLVFSIAAVLCLLLPVITVGSERGLGWQRKVYWSSTFGSAACVFVASLPNIATGLIFVVFVLFITTLRAYFSSQYIKIGGHVIAFHSATEIRPRPGRSGELGTDEPYSPTVSAARLWWLQTVGVGVIGAGNMWKYVVDREDLRYGILGLGIVVAAAVLSGVGDAMHLQRIARGQHVQFAILSLASVGIFPVLYVIAHWVTLRVKKSS